MSPLSLKNDERRASLWFRALTVLSQSPKPDLSPLSWNLLRLTLNNRPHSENDICPHCVVSQTFPTETVLQGLGNPAERTCTTIQYLICEVERCVQLTEINAVRGLLAMAAKSPFYAPLSAIRILLSQVSDPNEKVGRLSSYSEIARGKKPAVVSRLDKSLLPA